MMIQLSTHGSDASDEQPETVVSGECAEAA